MGKSLQVQPSLMDGARYEYNEDLDDWMEGDCAMARLCSMPQRHGSLRGVGRPRSAGTHSATDFEGMFFTVPFQGHRSTSAFWQTSMLLQSSPWRPSSASSRPSSAGAANRPFTAFGNTLSLSPTATRRRPASSG